MSQNDLTIANQGFASFRSDLNSALQALGSTNSGTSAPSTTFANQLFYDTTNNILKIRNEDNDAFISLFTLDQTNDLISGFSSPITITTADNSDNLTLISTDADASTGANLVLQRDSASPADNDLTGTIKFKADNDAGEVTDLVSIFSKIIDASDGTEDASLFVNSIVGGSQISRLNITPTEIVINDDSIDSDFRVESNNLANMFFIDGGGDRIYIGRDVSDGLFSSKLQIESNSSDAGLSIHRNGGNPYLNMSASATANFGDDTLVSDDDPLGTIYWSGADGTDRSSGAAYIAGFVDGTPGSNDMPGRITFGTTPDGSTSPAERARINSSGVLMVGQTAFNPANVGTSLTSSGQLNGTASGDISLQLNRTSSNGNIAEFRYNNSAIGRIGSGTGRFSINGTNGSTGSGIQFDINAWLPQTHSGSLTDDDIDLGSGTYRFDDVFATNGTIQTSDRNEKQDIEELTDAEKRVAVVAKGLLRKYRFKDAVAEKGDKARTHFGIIAQDLQDAFTAESLDASKYAVFCSNTWWEKEITVDAVEAKDAVYEEVTDSDGMKTSNLISGAIKAQDAYTYIDTKQESTEGYTEKTRLGVRYSELLAFIISAI